MLQTLKTLAFRYNRYMTYVGRKRTHAVLSNSSDRLLEDAGFSRYLLEKGVQAWPWKIEDDNRPLQPIAFEELANNRVVSELQACDSKERHGLEKSRDSIDVAAQQGAHQIEHADKRKAA